MNNESKDKISDMKVVPLKESKYMKTLRLEFVMNGIQKYWDVLQVHDSVSVLIFNTTRQVVVLVKQFRPSMYLSQIPDVKPGLVIDTQKYPINKGYSLEICAGIIDKEASISKIAQEEVLEECGYDVPETDLRHIFSSRSVGVSGQQQTFYYVEVTDSQKVAKGGGLRSEGEFIEVVELTIPQLQAYMADKTIFSPASFVAGVEWFFGNILPQLKLKK